MATPPFTAEARLLFRSVRAADEHGAPPWGENGDVDWAGLASLAEREKLLPLLWPALASARAPVPEAIASALRRQALVGEFCMGALEARLAQAVRLLDAADIPVMLLKGSAMALSVYGSFARRPMGDIDLLVPAAQARAAWSVLLRAGWTREYPDRDDFYAKHHHLCPLVSPGGDDIVIEVHRSLLASGGPFELDERVVWASAVPVDAWGCTIRVPAPEIQVLHMCVHFAWSHAMTRALSRTVRDLAALTRARTIDWGHVIELAWKTRATSCCYWTLRLSRTLGEVPVPPLVLEALAPASPAFVRDALERVITTAALDPAGAFPPSRRIGRLVWERAIRPRESGHGSVRPWMEHAAWEGDVDDAAPRSLGRMAGHVARLGDWVRFLSILLGVGGNTSDR